MAAIGEAHVKIVPDVSEFADRLRRAADVLENRATHQCPPEGSGIMPCCGRTPFEVSRSDRMTVHADFVTCLGGAS